MFEFQILRYEGLDNPEELLIELYNQENPDQVQTICHQDLQFKDESKSDCENPEPLISIPTPGLLSIILSKQGQEFGVLLNTDLLSEIKTAEFLPLFSPAREIESLNGDSQIKVLIAVQQSQKDFSDFFTQFSFYLYRQYSDLRKTSNIESQESTKKLRNQEFELLKAQNDFNVFRAFKEEKIQLLENTHLQDLIVKNNMEAVVGDLEAQNFALEDECQRKNKKTEVLMNVVNCLNEEKEKTQRFSEAFLDDFQGEIKNLLQIVEKTQKENFRKNGLIKKLEFERKMLEQSLTLEKLRNQGKNAKENFYLIFKDFLNKETSGSLEKIVEELELLIKELFKKNSKHTSKIEELEGKIRETQKEYKNLENSLSEKILNKSEKKKGIQKNLSQVQEKLQKKHQKILVLKQNFSEQIMKNMEEQENLKQVFANEKKELLSEIQTLKTRFESERSSLIIKSQKELKELELVLKKTKDDSDKDKKITAEEFSKKINLLIEKHESERKKYTEEHQTTLAMLRNCFDKEKHQILEEHQTSLALLRSSFDQEKHQILEEKLEASRENERIINQLKNKFEGDKQKMVNDQNDLVIENERVVSQIKEKTDAEKRKMMNEKNELIAEHEKNVKQLVSDFELAKSKLLKEKNDILAENSKNLSALIEKFESEKRNSSQSRQEEISQYERTLKTLKSQKDAEKQQSFKEIEELKQEHASILHSKTTFLEAECKKQLETQSEHYSKQISQLRVQFESEKSKLTLENIENSKKSEVLLLKSQETHENLIKTLKISYEEKLRTKSDYLQRVESELSEESRFKAELQSKLNQALQKIENLLLDLQSTKVDLSSKISENTLLSSELSDQSKIIESLKKDLENERNSKKIQSEEFKFYIKEMKRKFTS